MLVPDNFHMYVCKPLYADYINHRQKNAFMLLNISSGHPLQLYQVIQMEIYIGIFYY